MENYFGKMSPAKKAMRLRYRKNISLQEAWDEVLGKTTKSPKGRKVPKSRKSPKKEKKMQKKDLDKLSLKKLQKLAKKHKVSVHKKGSTVLVKKSTLLNRLKKSRSIKKILESAKKIKSRFGETFFPGVPKLDSLAEMTTGQTAAYQNKRYARLPTQFIAFNNKPDAKSLKLYPRAFGMSSTDIPTSVSHPALVKFGKKYKNYFQ